MAIRVKELVEVNPIQVEPISIKNHALYTIESRGGCIGHCYDCPSKDLFESNAPCYTKNVYKNAVDWLMEHGYERELLEALIV